MPDLIREECYILIVGLEEHFLRVQELISPPAHWPCAFRIQIAASSGRAGKKLFGVTAREVLDLAAAYLSEPLTEVRDQLGGEEFASPSLLKNLPNRLTCGDIVGKTSRKN